ncbi:MAG: hypothetical protein ABUK01_09040 [Leptospirales bacterium]
MRLVVKSPVKELESVAVEISPFSKRIQLFFDNFLIPFKKGTHQTNTHVTPSGVHIHFHVRRPCFTFYPVVRFAHSEARFLPRLKLFELFLMYIPFILFFGFGITISLATFFIWGLDKIEPITVSASSLAAPSIFIYFLFDAYHHPISMAIEGGFLTIFGLIFIIISSLLVRLELPIFFRTLFCTALVFLGFFSSNFIYMLLFKRPFLLW